MKVTKKDLEKSQVELSVELTIEEFKPYIELGVKKVSGEVKIEGFRKGKVPFDILKQKVGEMAILEESARIAINKTIDDVIKKNTEQQPVGQPKVDITKLAPDNPLGYKIVLAFIPSITLGNYKDFKIKQEKVKVDDSEVSQTLEKIQEMRIKEKISDKEVSNGDKALVSIEMFLDKVPIEGGQTKDTAVIIGKDYLVPGFDKKLIGAKKGDKKEFSLPYPKDHHMKNIAGKMVEFVVEVKEVYAREIPKLDDELAKTMGAKNIEDIKKSVKENLKNEKQHKADQKIEMEILNKIMDKSKFGDMPDVLVQHEAETIMKEMEQNISQQGGKFEDYLSSIKKTKEQFMLDMAPDALKRVKSAILIREIATVEKIEASEKELEKEVEKLLKQYKGYEKVEARVKEPSYRNYLMNVIVNKKVIDKLKEWNLDTKATK
jgi:trigger factor